MNNTLVSVNILSFNRKDELRNTLQKVFEQDYKNIEVIVVDNASIDGTAKMVQSDFPEAKLISLPKNIGISGWNYALEVASGDYILLLDDDSYPSADSIEKAKLFFERNKSVSIIAAKVINNNSGIIETSSFNERPNFFVGCGAFIKRDVIEKIGGFNQLIFIYLHELDYCVRCYDYGFEIRYVKNVIVYHNLSNERSKWKNEDPFKTSFRFYHYFISYSIFLLQRFYPKYIIIYLPKWIVNRFIIAISYRYFKEFFSAVFHLIKICKKIISGRRVLKETTQHFYNNGNIPFIDPEYFNKK